MTKLSFGDTQRIRTKLFVGMLIEYEKQKKAKNIIIRWKTKKDINELYVKSSIDTLRILFNTINLHTTISNNQIHIVIKTLKFIGILVPPNEHSRGEYLLKFKNKDKEYALNYVDKQWVIAKKRQKREQIKNRDNILTKYEYLKQKPDILSFRGRDKDKNSIKKFIKDKEPLIIVTGEGGIGKSCLVAKVVEEVKNKFHYIYWINLRKLSSFKEVLELIISNITESHKISYSIENKSEIHELAKLFKQTRCLLILDNADTDNLIKSGGYRQYINLLEKLTHSIENKSTIILTRKESLSNNYNLPQYKTIKLNKLELVNDYKKIVNDKGLSIYDEYTLKKIIEIVHGNIVGVNLIYASINNSFNGKIKDFIEFDKNNNLMKYDSFLNWFFSTIDKFEHEFIYWIAINFEAVSLTQLRKDFLSNESKERTDYTCEKLKEKAPLIFKDDKYTVDTVLLEYAINKFVEEIEKEIIGVEKKFLFLHNYALFKAESKKYLKQSQIGFIVRPLLNRLIDFYGSEEGLINRLLEILSDIREDSSYSRGYAGGNIFNLLHYLKANLDSYDFSGLTLRQADFKNIKLHNVNFSKTNIMQSVFLDIFDHILTVTFSPQGSLMAAGDANGQIHFWKVDSNEQRRIIHGHTNYIRSVVFSSDGKTLASAGSDSKIRLWDVETGKCRLTIPDGINRIWSLSFSPDDNFVASGGSDKQVKIWSLETGKCEQRFTKHKQTIRSVKYSSDGKKIASGGDDKSIKLWEVDSGKCESILTRRSTQELCCLAYSPLGELLASGDQSGNIFLWNLQTRERYKKFLNYSKKYPVRTIAFSSDGKILASGGDDNLVRLWNVETGKCLQTLQGHTNKIWTVAFSPDDKTIVSGSEDQTVRLWDIADSKCSKIIQGYKNLVVRLAFSPDGQTLASGYQDNNIVLWNYDKGKHLRTLKGHLDTVQSFAFSPDGTFLASGSKDSTIKIWDLKTCSCIKTLQGHKDNIWAVAFSLKGNKVASGSNDCSIRIWDVKTGDCQTLNEDKTEHKTLIWAVAFSPNGKMIASGDDDGIIKIWDIETPKCIQTLSAELGKSWVLAFSPDGQTISCSSGKQIIASWDIGTGELLKNIPQPEDQAWTAGFSFDRHYVANAIGNSQIDIWDTTTGEKISNLKGHSRPIWTVVFSEKEDNILASSSWDETIKIWDINTEKCLRTLRIKRPYEGMIINEVKGLTESQKDILKSLGAIENLDIKSI